MAEAVQGAQSFARSIAVLQLIADAGEPKSRAELIELCELKRPTLYRIMASLEAEGLIEATTGNRFRLGSRLINLSRQALAQNDVRRIAEPFLMRLRDQTGETVHLAIRSGKAMTYIDKMESREAVRMASTIGTRVAFHSTSVGRAFLSALAPADAKDLISQLDLDAMTPATITDPGVLMQSLRQARHDGFVQEREENEPGISCFGAAIMDASDRPVAAISVSVPLYRLGRAERYTRPLCHAVAEVSMRLGHQGVHSGIPAGT